MKRFKLRTFYLSIVMFIVLLYLELIFRLFNNIDIFNISLLYVMVFNLFMTIFICIIGKLFNRKVNKVMFLGGLFLLGFLYSVQLCVFKMFGFYFDWTLIGASGQIASFAGDGLDLVIANTIGLILNFMPFILFLIYNKIIVIEKDDVKTNIVKIVLCVLTGLSFYGILNINKNEVNSSYKLYTSVNNIDLNVRTFGVVNAFFIDTYRNVFGFEEIIDIPNKPLDDVNNNDAFSITSRAMKKTFCSQFLDTESKGYERKAAKMIELFEQTNVNYTVEPFLYENNKNPKASVIEKTMQDMNTGINDISMNVDEGAKGVSDVAQNAVSLVNAISLIHTETENSQSISSELQGEVKRFERV